MIVLKRIFAIKMEESKTRIVGFCLISRCKVILHRQIFDKSLIYLLTVLEILYRIISYYHI